MGVIMRPHPHTAEDGFTLIELLIVIVIIGILAAIAIPVYLRSRESGYDATAKLNLRSLATEEESYVISTRQYGTIAELQAAGSVVNRNAEVTLRVVRFTRDVGYCLSAKHANSPRTWYWDSQAGGLQANGTPDCPSTTSGTAGDSLP